MKRFCMVDTVTQVSGVYYVTPWMSFDTLEACLEARKAGHNSWPREIACMDSLRSKAVLTRRARLAKRGESHWRATESAYMQVGQIVPWYNLPDATPESWKQEEESSNV